MEFLPPRQIDILEIAKRDGRVDVESLAKHFDVTVQTIRKDLNDLCEVEKLHRVHGGAIFPSNTSNLAYMARREIASEGKRLIAQETAKLIPNNASLFINIGTTTEQVAYALRGHQDLIVVTNNLNVAVILSNAPNIELVIAGGTVRKSDGGIVGAATIDLIKQFKVDFAIIGASAIDEDGALLDFDYGEVRVAQAIMAQARRKILVADSTKFERRAPVHIGRLADINVLITDTTPPREVSDLIDAVGTELIIASTNVAKAQGVDR